MEANHSFPDSEPMSAEFNASIDLSAEMIDVTAVESESIGNMTSFWTSIESLPPIELPRRDTPMSSENFCGFSAISVDDLTIVSELDDAVRDESYIGLPPLRIKETRKRGYFSDQILNSTFILSPRINLSEEMKNNDFQNSLRKSNILGSLHSENETTGITRKSVTNGAEQDGEMNEELTSHMESPRNKQERRISKLIRSSTLNSVTPLRMDADVDSPEVSVINEENDTFINDACSAGETVRNSILYENDKETSSQLFSLSESSQNANPRKKHVRRCAALKDFVKKRWKSIRELGKYHGSYLAMKSRHRVLTDVKMVRCNSTVLYLAATKPNQFAANKRSILKNGASLSGMLRLSIDCSERSLDLKVVSGFDMHLNPNFAPETFVQMSLISCTNDAEYTWRSPVENHRTNPKYNGDYSINLTSQDYRSYLVLTVYQLTDDPLLNIFIGQMSFNVSTLLFKNMSGYYKLLPEIDLVKNIKVAEDHEFRKVTLKRGEEFSKNLGFVLVKFQSCIVEFVKSDGLAAEAGIMAGDEIIQIDGVSCLQWEVEKIIEHLRNSKTSIQLTIRRRPCNYYNNDISNYDDLDVSYFKGED